MGVSLANNVRRTCSEIDKILCMCFIILLALSWVYEFNEVSGKISPKKIRICNDQFTIEIIVTERAWTSYLYGGPNFSLDTIPKKLKTPHSKNLAIYSSIFY